MASYASSSGTGRGGSTYNPATFGSGAITASNNALNELANRYKNNETIGNIVVGRLADNASTLGNIGMADLYNRSTLSTMAQYQRAVDQGRKGDTLQIMAAEGGISKDLYNTQYAGQERVVRASGQEQRSTLETQGTQERMGIAETGRQQRLGISATGEQQRMLADTQGGWDLRRIGAQGSEDRQNIAATGAEQRALAQTQGAEERASMSQGTVEELRRRADARRQASSYGGRFYA